MLSLGMVARSARKVERSEEMRARSAAAAEQDITAAASAKVGNKSRFEKAAGAARSAAFNFPATSPTLPKRRQPNDSASLLTRALSSIGGGAAHAVFCSAKYPSGFAALPRFGFAETRRVRRPHYSSHTGVISSVSQPFSCVNPSKPSSAQRSVTLRYSNVVIRRLSSGKSAAL